jgi:hypothetical protein
MLGKLVYILLMVGLFVMEFIRKSLKDNLVLNFCGWRRSNGHLNNVCDRNSALSD